jgi:galactitol-specific phosphotransferase system IIB component
MKGKIAIEPTLSNVKSYLSEIGYTVESMNVNGTDNLTGYDAIVVTSLSKNLAGINDTNTKAAVINADGLTPQEVASQLDRLK